MTFLAAAPSIEHHQRGYGASLILQLTKLVNQAHAEGLISNHPVWDDAVVKLNKLRADPTGPNPFLMGKILMDRYTEVQEECIQAALAQ